jgi:hypothetical protein
MISTHVKCSVDERKGIEQENKKVFFPIHFYFIQTV